MQLCACRCRWGTVKDMKRGITGSATCGRALFFVTVLSLVGCSSPSAVQADLSEALGALEDAGVIIVSAADDRSDRVVLEQNRAGDTHIDATDASRELLELLGAGDGEAVTTGEGAYVRDTSQALAAGAKRGEWVPTVVQDPLLHGMQRYMKKPFDLLFGEGGVHAGLSGLRFTGRDDSWSATAARGETLVEMREGRIISIVDAAFAVSIKWPEPVIKAPAGKVVGDETRKVVDAGRENQQMGVLAQMAVGIQRSAAMMIGARNGQVGGDAVSTRDGAAVAAAVTPPKGKPGNTDVTVKISTPGGPMTVWDGENSVDAEGETPRWMQVSNKLGSACVRLGTTAGGLGVSGSGGYRAGEQVSAAELKKAADVWALVVLSPKNGACNGVTDGVEGAGTGW